MPKLAASDFAKAATRLRKKILAAKAAEAEDALRDADDRRLRNAETVGGVIRIECYRYYRFLKKDGQKQLAAYLNEANGRWWRHPKEDVTNALRLLEDGRSEWFITNPRRERIADELRIAHHFGIHSKLLLAFIHALPPGRDARAALLNSKASPEWVADYQQQSQYLRRPETKRTPGPEERKKRPVSDRTAR
jgi:hypothetical protein